MRDILSALNRNDAAGGVIAQPQVRTTTFLWCANVQPQSFDQVIG